MPPKFIINGGKQLKGEVNIRGSKNTILPFIAAALLTDEEVVFENVPDISDVHAMAAIAASLEADIRWDERNHRLSIIAENLKSHELDAELSGKFRGSFLFSGALLGRMKKAALPYPGGDAIGARPLATHFHALEKLGVCIEENGKIVLDGSNMRSAVIVLEETSVTATENTILAAVLTEGITEIRLADSSPHVQELIALLNAMGGSIGWTGPGAISIKGVKNLGGVHYTVNPDEIEVSSFAALAAATNSEITIRGVALRYYDAALLQLAKMGVEYRLTDTDLIILKAKRPYLGFKIQSGLYPKLMSDHLPLFAVLATQATGESLIHEWLYDGRLRYIEELRKMGANATVLDPHRAIIVGPTPLYGKEISSLDVRSGMTLIIAALVATGETTLLDVHHIDRGYERIDERLKALGADIKRVAS